MSHPALTGGLDLALSQREWANDLTTWVIHNKLLYTGPSALDHFSQALLLHLQSMSSTNTIASAASILLNQVSPGCLSAQAESSLCMEPGVSRNIHKHVFFCWLQSKRIHDDTHPLNGVFFERSSPTPTGSLETAW